MENKPVLLLLSGGIDSTTLLAQLKSQGKKIYALSFNYGQKNRIELAFAKENAARFGAKHLEVQLDKGLFVHAALVNQQVAVSTYSAIELPQAEVNTYVPFRNLIFIAQALCFAETHSIEQIYLGFNQDDSLNYWDCRKAFVEEMNRIANPRGIAILTPFIDLEKKEIVGLAHQLEVNLEETLTCYQPVGREECGTCLSCRIKQKAMQGA